MLFSVSGRDCIIRRTDRQFKANLFDPHRAKRMKVGP